MSNSNKLDDKAARCALLEAENRILRRRVRDAAAFLDVDGQGPWAERLRAGLDDGPGITIGVLGTLAAAAEASPTLLAVAHERLRQIEVEGFGPEHDDQHEGGEIAQAAEAYLVTAAAQVKHGAVPACFFPRVWPEKWGRSWWKCNQSHFRNRIKALALGCAEGDRLKRAVDRLKAAVGKEAGQ